MKQGLQEGRPRGYSWISHAAMKVLQDYFAELPDANLHFGIALYMGISYLLSSEMRDGDHAGVVRATKKRITGVCGLSSSSITRYAEHLVAADVMELREQEGGSHIWRLSEPGEGPPDPTLADLPPHHDDAAPRLDDSATNNEQQTTSEEVKKDTSPEIERLCQLMADLQNNRAGAEEWRVTAKGRSDMRKLLQLDKRPAKEVEMAIRWVHQHDFWSSNILSPGTLRKQFARIKMEASNGQKRKCSPAAEEHRRRNLARERGESL